VRRLRAFRNYKPILDASISRHLPKARAAAEKICQAPGLKLRATLWATAGGSRVQLLQKYSGVNPNFILDGASAQADKTRLYSIHRQPARREPATRLGPANHQPPASSSEIPGYHNPP
jgi:penicillin amidase